MRIGAWYVAQAQPGLEATAIYNLSRDKFVAVAPSVADKKQRFYPGYVFVRLYEPEDCYFVNRTRGIVKLLPTHLKEPLALPEGWVEDLMGRIERGDFNEKNEEQLLRRFIPGEVVESLIGAVSGRPGRFSRYHKGSGVVIYHLLGRDVEYKVPLHQLKSVGDPVSPESRSAPKVLVAA